MQRTTACRQVAVPARLRALWLPFFVGTVLFGLNARAADQKTAVVLDPKVTGVLEPLDLAVIEKSVNTALQEQQFQVASKPERDNIISATGNLRNCYRNDCLEQLGRLLGAHLVIAYKIKVDFIGLPASGAASAKGKKGEPDPSPAAASPLSFEINAALYNIEVGAIGARVEMKCQHCSGPQVGPQAADMIKRAVLEDASKQREMLEISSNPSNSSVLVDGVELGVTPYKRPTFIGKHDITVRHTGYKSTNQEVIVAENRKSSAEFQLEAGQDPVKYIKEYGPRPKWRLALGGALIGVGLIGIGVGAYGLAINGTCGADAVPPMTNDVCPVRNGVPAGIGFLVAGDVLAAAGAVTLALPGPRNPLTPDMGPDTFGDKTTPDGKKTSSRQSPTASLSMGMVSSGLGFSLSGSY